MTPRPIPRHQYTDWIELLLICGHHTCESSTAWLTSKLAFCPICETSQQWVRALDTSIGGYTVTCKRRGCTYTRRCGNSYKSACFIAGVHARNNAEHTTTVKIGSTVLYETVSHDQNQEIPF